MTNSKLIRVAKTKLKKMEQEWLDSIDKGNYEREKMLSNWYYGADALLDHMEAELAKSRKEAAKMAVASLKD